MNNTTSTPAQAFEAALSALRSLDLFGAEKALEAIEADWAEAFRVAVDTVYEAFHASIDANEGDHGCAEYYFDRDVESLTYTLQDLYRTAEVADLFTSLTGA